MKIIIDNREFEASDGSSVAAAVIASGAAAFRNSVSGEPRFPVCGIGICFECRLTIDGVTHVRSCQVEVREGMVIETA
jgi:sarcosine oxidase subunit alpha